MGRVAPEAVGNNKTDFINISVFTHGFSRNRIWGLSDDCFDLDAGSNNVSDSVGLACARQCTKGNQRKGALRWLAERIEAILIWGQPERVGMSTVHVSACGRADWATLRWLRWVMGYFSSTAYDDGKSDDEDDCCTCVRRWRTKLNEIGGLEGISVTINGDMGEQVGRKMGKAISFQLDGVSKYMTSLCICFLSWL